MGAKQDTQDALLLEELSDKVLHHLPHSAWTELFLGAGRGSIHFAQCALALVHVDAPLAGVDGQSAGRFREDLQRITVRHGGSLDPYCGPAALALFDEPGAAVAMAMELQQAAAGIALRVGVVSGSCTLASFRAQGRLCCTPLGGEPARAAEVAAGAQAGGIAISRPQALPPVHRRDFEPTRPGFFDLESDPSSFALPRGYEDVDIRC